MSAPAPPRFEDVKAHAFEIVQGVLNACDPGVLIRPHLGGLASLSSAPEPIHLVAFGKASRAMTVAAGQALGDRIRFGICVSGEARFGRPVGFPATVGLMHADHPLATQDNIEAAEAVRYAVSEFGRGAAGGGGGRGEAGTMLALISGGGSAHLTLPAQGLSLEDLRAVTLAMLRAGATIQQLNCVRKHIEQLKGGRLAAMAHPGRVRALVMSDVNGDPLDVIASGPFAPDPTTFREALDTMQTLGVHDDHPRIVSALERGVDGELPETLKPGAPELAHVSHTIIGSNLHVLAAAAAGTKRLGFRTTRCDPGLSGAAAEAGAALAKEALELQRCGEHACAIMLGGECTVKVRGNGAGGRSQEVALAAAVALDGIPGIGVLTFATDGVDGPTDAAGALVTGQTVPDGTQMGIDCRAALERNDSYSVLSRLGNTRGTEHFKPGPTGTNLCDIALALVY